MKSFRYAFRGLAHVVKTEKNMRVHICFVFYVVCAGFVTRLSGSEWAAVLICAGLVLSLESLNTALETLCDTVCPEKHKGVKLAKDASAAAVLCAAVVSAAAGLVIFFGADKLDNFVKFVGQYPAVMALIILTLIPALLFVFGKGKNNGARERENHDRKR